MGARGAQRRDDRTVHGIGLISIRPARLVAFRDQVSQCIAQSGEHADLVVNVPNLCHRQVSGLEACAAPGRTTTKAEQFFNLAQGKAECLCLLDEVNDTSRLQRVLAVTARPSPRGLQKSPALVIPERISADARACGKVPDAKGLRSPRIRL
jgi:hypothetical protein